MSALAPPNIWTDPITFLALFSIAIVPYTVLAIVFILYTRSKPLRKKSSIVLVLGDFGRSPRMMYHAQSLVDHGWDTYVVAYGDTAPIASLTAAGAGAAAAHPGRPAAVKPSTGSAAEPGNGGDDPKAVKGRCHFHYLSPLTALLSLPLPWAARAAIRLVHQCFAVLYIIWVQIPCHTEYIIVQTPPAIPTLMLVQIAAMVSGSKVVVDWHNTGWSVLAQRLGSFKGLMWLAKSIERITGQNAHAHLFVSHAQHQSLSADFELHGQMQVLHDRPPAHFRRTSDADKAELFERLAPVMQLPEDYWWEESQLVISSTSWTADEDFGPLIDALEVYDVAASVPSPTPTLSSSTSLSEPDEERLPKLLVLITGKGPLLPAFRARLAARGRPFRNIVVRCLFVPAADYPILLGCADVGLSFHTSTSGTDLPMKIVDMLGCGVPVFARGYGALGELVQDGREGRWFDTAHQLAELLVEYMAHPAKIDALRANIDSLKRWEDNWDEVVNRRILAPESKLHTS